MRQLQLLIITLLCAGFIQAQDMSMESLKAMQAEKQAAADALAAEAADLQKKIDEFPGWKVGGVGIIGADLNANDNWFAINTPNASSNGLGINASAFANNNQEKWFWNNLLTLNLKQTTTKLTTDGNEVKALTDALDLSSLAGYKLAPKWAISAEGKYTSTLLAFNRPGKATISVGATWLPIPNAVVVFHPLGYEANFPSGDFVSLLGCKVGATYSAQILPGVAWSTNLSAFIPYTSDTGTLQQFPLSNDITDRTAPEAEFDLGADPISGQSTDVAYERGDLTNWTWLNTFSTNIFKGIGLGLNVGLRKDRQVANQWQYNRFGSIEEDNPLQFYYSLGLSYTL
jgi:hypothetical protein